MAPFVLVGGLLLVRKIHRSDLVYSFFVVAVAATLAGYISSGIGLYSILQRIFLETPIMFLAFVMLTEPITTPPRAWSQMIYGAIAGFLFAPAVHIGSLYFTPELALLAGNIFSYAVSPKRRLILTLKEKKQIATGTYDFVFDSDEKMNFRAGQYLEWTLPHEKPDSRGNRRYFTIASSPTEQDLRLGVKFYSPSSSFKKKLLEMKPGEKLLASQLAGDFTLPADSKEKLVWIAGGIGVTPFRSMAKYLVDRGERRDVTMLYSSRTSADVAYADVFEEARQKIGLKTIYILSEAGTIKEAGQDAFVRVGQIDRAMIEMEIPDYRQRVFYISGPHAMVSIFQMTLQKMGVSRRKIVVDYFPGF
jgi:ferredoxin-NADP reductase